MQMQLQMLPYKVSMSKSGMAVSEFLVPEIVQALKLSAKKHFILGLTRAYAQLWFHPEAGTSMARWNFPKHLSSCLYKTQSF